MNNTKTPSNHYEYCLITPCRNEIEYAQRSLDSVTKQTVLPALWIIVDDGSTDGTTQLLNEYANKFSFIKIIHRPDRGFRKLGGGVIDAFYDGYNTINPKDYDYICKLDLDLEIPTEYFETLMDKMKDNPRIGTCSGKPYFYLNNKLVSENCGDDNSVGMIKFYRTQCFLEIGGFVRELMWDGIDGHRCRMLGWIAVSWDISTLRFTHLRPMGTSDKSWWTGRMRHGTGQYFMGSSLIYFLASVIYRLIHPPRIIGSLAMLTGYLKAWISQTPQYPDKTFRIFLRKYQMSCLIRGKRRALELLNDAQFHIWKRTHI